MKKILSLFLTAATVLSLTACGDAESVVLPNSDGYAEGKAGDTMRTCFFDYTVNSAYLSDSYGGRSADDGCELLVAEITVKNTTGSSLEMYDSDFQLQWNDSSADAFEYSLTFYDEEDAAPLSDEMLPGIYSLARDESRTGLLVFQIPAGSGDFSISYQEIFSDESTGDTFFVYFDAKKQ
ncbi:MAG: DUF4352 domain-containing protein [Roseburia sp.]|nr:DUF4352 domain-containing protein [Roseburia sp.]MCM1098339.1 DUF4352 domain-containing protein [Ruminococcus flavefaciens]